MGKHWLVRLWVIFTALCLNHVYAAESSFNWRGFITAGYSQTLANNTYLSYIGKDPNFLYDSKLGIAFSSNLSENLEASAQFVAQGSSQTFSPDVDWAYLSYRPNDSIMLRAGRLRFPMWLIADYYNVGYSYIWARPPPEVYSQNILSSFFGVLGSYSYALPTGTLSLAMYGGSSPLDLPFQSNFNGQISPSSLTGSFDRLLGATLSYENLSLLVRVNYARTYLQSSLNVQGDVLPGSSYGAYTLFQESFLRLPLAGNYQFWSMGISAKPFKFLRIISEYFGAELDNTPVSNNAYLTAGVPIGIFEPHFTVATSGSTAGTGYNRYALGLNTSVASNALLKVQWEGIDVKTGAGPLLSNPTGLVQVVSANINAVF